ncbi:methyltransferase domain-containing protein [Desulfovibrio aminophilus]|uniref:class I SAM-dependent methyltransferase n=1 Tax=Desulfovibrio aminophilus TaxID=81425 RepID=UPI00339A7EE1
MNSDFLFEAHRNLPRQGPGDEASTLRALVLAGSLPEELHVLDLGCGPGMQTLVLARALPGARITAVDLHEPFLDELRARARAADLDGRLETLAADMAELPFEDGSFDLIWAEGSIYNLGFDRGLRLWKRLLRPGGVLACTELAWLVSEPPQEAVRYWETGYPGMRQAPANMEAARTAGYDILGSFPLPLSAWRKDYYEPLRRNLEAMRVRRADDAEALETIAAEEAEMDIFRRYGTSYGYVFYILRKP